MGSKPGTVNRDQKLVICDSILIGYPALLSADRLLFLLSDLPVAALDSTSLWWCWSLDFFDSSFDSLLLFSSSRFFVSLLWLFLSRDGVPFFLWCLGRPDLLPDRLLDRLARFFFDRLALPDRDRRFLWAFCFGARTSAVSSLDISPSSRELGRLWRKPELPLLPTRFSLALGDLDLDLRLFLLDEECLAASIVSDGIIFCTRIESS